MFTLALYAKAYAELWSWMVDGDDWVYANTPIVNYLQSGLGTRQVKTAGTPARCRRTTAALFP